MKSYRKHNNNDDEIKEKDKRYIYVRSKSGRYDVECVDKNSWDYWEYYCSDGKPGRWPATGGSLLFVFMVWCIYILILALIRLIILPGLSRLKDFITPLAAKVKKKLIAFYKKLLRRVQMLYRAVFSKRAPLNRESAPRTRRRQKE